MKFLGRMTAAESVRFVFATPEARFAAAKDKADSSTQTLAGINIDNLDEDNKKEIETLLGPDGFNTAIKGMNLTMNIERFQSAYNERFSSADISVDGQFGKETKKAMEVWAAEKETANETANLSNTITPVQKAELKDTTVTSIETSDRQINLNSDQLEYIITRYLQQEGTTIQKRNYRHNTFGYRVDRNGDVTVSDITAANSFVGRYNLDTKYLLPTSPKGQYENPSPPLRSFDALGEDSNTTEAQIIHTLEGEGLYLEVRARSYDLLDEIYQMEYDPHRGDIPNLLLDLEGRRNDLTTEQRVIYRDYLEREIFASQDPDNIGIREAQEAAIERARASLNDEQFSALENLLSAESSNIDADAIVTLTNGQVNKTDARRLEESLKGTALTTLKYSAVATILSVATGGSLTPVLFVPLFESRLGGKIEIDFALEKSAQDISMHSLLAEKESRTAVEENLYQALDKKINGKTDTITQVEQTALTNFYNKKLSEADEQYYRSEDALDSLIGTASKQKEASDLIDIDLEVNEQTVRGTTRALIRKYEQYERSHVKRSYNELDWNRSMIQRGQRTVPVIGALVGMPLELIRQLGQGTDHLDEKIYDSMEIVDTQVSRIRNNILKKQAKLNSTTDPQKKQKLKNEIAQLKEDEKAMIAAGEEMYDVVIDIIPRLGNVTLSQSIVAQELLDGVGEDAGHLNKHLRSRDRENLSSYLENVTKLYQRLDEIGLEGHFFNDPYLVRELDRSRKSVVTIRTQLEVLGQIPSTRRDGAAIAMNRLQDAVDFEDTKLERLLAYLDNPTNITRLTKDNQVPYEWIDFEGASNTAYSQTLETHPEERTITHNVLEITNTFNLRKRDVQIAEDIENNPSFAVIKEAPTTSWAEFYTYFKSLGADLNIHYTALTTSPISAIDPRKVPALGSLSREQQDIAQILMVNKIRELPPFTQTQKGELRKVIRDSQDLSDLNQIAVRPSNSNSNVEQAINGHLRNYLDTFKAAYSDTYDIVIPDNAYDIDTAFAKGVSVYRQEDSEWDEILSLMVTNTGEEGYTDYNAAINPLLNRTGSFSVMRTDIPITIKRKGTNEKFQIIQLPVFLLDACINLAPGQSGVEQKTTTHEQTITTLSQYESTNTEMLGSFHASENTMAAISQGSGFVFGPFLKLNGGASQLKDGGDGPTREPILDLPKDNGAGPGRG